MGVIATIKCQDCGRFVTVKINPATNKFGPCPACELRTREPGFIDRYYFDGACLFLVGLTALISFACLALAILAGWL